MIVIKNLRVEVLGEPLFEKVNIVIRSGERVGVVGTKKSDVTAFLRTIAGEDEPDEGSVTHEGERVAFVSLENVPGEIESLPKVLHSRPTCIVMDAASVSAPADAVVVARFIAGFRGGVVLASDDTSLMLAAKVTRVLELHASTKLVSSFAGNFTDFLVEREKSQARLHEAYEKQQREKRRIEDWLERKRGEATRDRSPEKGATIRAKTKYLEREILSKEIPNPME